MRLETFTEKKIGGRMFLGNFCDQAPDYNVWNVRMLQYQLHAVFTEEMNNGLDGFDCNYEEVEINIQSLLLRVTNKII
jgi:hypothetical protein